MVHPAGTPQALLLTFPRLRITQGLAGSRNPEGIKPGRSTGTEKAHHTLQAGRDGAGISPRKRKGGRGSLLHNGAK